MGGGHRGGFGGACQGVGLRGEAKRTKGQSGGRTTESGLQAGGQNDRQAGEHRTGLAKCRVGLVGHRAAGRQAGGRARWAAKPACHPLAASLHRQPPPPAAVPQLHRSCTAPNSRDSAPNSQDSGMGGRSDAAECWARQEGATVIWPRHHLATSNCDHLAAFRHFCRRGCCHAAYAKGYCSRADCSSRWSARLRRHTAAPPRRLSPSSSSSPASSSSSQDAPPFRFAGLLHWLVASPIRFACSPCPLAPPVPPPVPTPPARSSAG